MNQTDRLKVLAEKLRPLWKEMEEEICGHDFVYSLPDDDVMCGFIARFLSESGVLKKVKVPGTSIASIQIAIRSAKIHNAAVDKLIGGRHESD